MSQKRFVVTGGGEARTEPLCGGSTGVPRFEITEALVPHADGR
jgi:hypothetical protein